MVTVSCGNTNIFSPFIGVLLQNCDKFSIASMDGNDFSQYCVHFSVVDLGYVQNLLMGKL